MKRTLMIGAGVLALMAGSAHAAGCPYSNQQARMASAEEHVADEQAESRLLALLKEQDAALEKERPVIHN